MNPKLLLISAMLASVHIGLHAENADAPTLSMHCVNPYLDVKFTNVGLRTATTEPIQFNVNQPAPLGSRTIFVQSYPRPTNKGVCTAKISEGYRFEGGSHGVWPGGTYNREEPALNHTMEQQVAVNVTQLDPRTQIYTIEDVPYLKVLFGNITYTLSARFKKDGQH